MVVAGMTLTVFIPRVLPVKPTLVRDLRFGCLFGVVGLLTMPMFPFRALLEAQQKGYLINSALLAQSLVITIASLLMARWRWGIAGQFAATLIGTCAFSAWVCYTGIRRLTGIWWQNFKHVRQSFEWKSIWNLNWPTLTYNTCGQVGLLTDNIIIAALLSPALVVPFFITQRLAALLQRELQGIGNASWVALTELYARGQTAGFNSGLIELTKLVAILAVAALVPIVAYNRYFVTMWVGERRYGGDLLTALAGLNAFLLALVSLWCWCIAGTGHVVEMVPGMLAQTVLNLALSLVFTIKFGLIGPVLGTLTALVLVSTWYIPMLLRRLFNISLMDLATAALVPVASAAPFSGVIWLMSRALPPRGWCEMSSEMILAALGYLVSWWIVGLSSVERHRWWQRMQALVPEGAW